MSIIDKQVVTDREGAMVRFLEQHPSFSPRLMPEGAVCGFEIGEIFVSLEEMDQIVFGSPNP